MSILEYECNALFVVILNAIITGLCGYICRFPQATPWSVSSISSRVYRRLTQLCGYITSSTIRAHNFRLK